MNKPFRARAPRLSPHLASLSILLAAAWLGPAGTPSRGQQAALQNTTRVGNFVFRFDRITTPGGSIRLEGNARVYTPDASTSPQIDISAPLITADSYAARRVRGSGGVSFKYSGVRAGEKAGDPPIPVNIQASAREVLLDTIPADGRRTLTLTGDLDGFYEIGKDRTVLKGQKAVISFGREPNDVLATFEGGSEGFELLLPDQRFGSQISLGTVSLRAQRAVFNQAKNTARLEGGARLSSNGPTSLQISGADFNANFVSDKEGGARRLSSLSSRGRISLSFALAPENVGASVSKTEDASYPFTAKRAVLSLVPQKSPNPSQAEPAASGAPNAQVDGEPKKPDSKLVPVRVDIAADSAIVNIDPKAKTQTLTLQGNVRGSYVLREVLSASRPASNPADSKPDAGTKPEADDGPVTLDLDIQGGQIEFPAFNLEL